MAQSKPSYFQDESAVTSRTAEVPAASFANGMNVGGSCAHGIGIDEGQADKVGTPEQFTLTDQDGAARTPQVSQSIGGDGYTDPSGWPSSGGSEGKGTDPIRLGENPTQAAKDADSALEGTVSDDGDAHLTDLATGWTAVP